ncbi:MAG: hypothetical protein ABSE00_09815 [Chitinispirillaceae bacterium]
MLEYHPESFQGLVTAQLINSIATTKIVVALREVVPAAPRRLIEVRPAPFMWPFLSVQTSI